MDVKYSFLLPFPVIRLFERFLSRFVVRIGSSKTRSSWLYGPFFINWLIRRIKPDLIHTMEFQHNAYRLYEAKKAFRGKFPKWLATNWGSDIYYYQHDAHHLIDIRNILRSIDFYSCECERDIAIARGLGMACESMPVTVNSGGFDLSKTFSMRNQVSPVDRKVILVKGYQHFAGRAVTALHALALVADVIKGYEIVIFSASPSTVEASRALAQKGVLPQCTIVDHSSHDAILDLHARSRVYIGISRSDAISTSVLEAMALGSFPIQTDTSCCDEWIKDGETGFIVPCSDVNLIADRIRASLTDDHLILQAFSLNWLTVATRLDSTIIRRRVHEIYDKCFDQSSCSLTAGRSVSNEV